MESNIELVVTETGPHFPVGKEPHQEGRGVICHAAVVSISFGIGDPATMVPASYIVLLCDGRTVEVNNAAEVWYSAT